MSRVHTDSDQHVSYIVGKLTRRPFQRHRSHLRIRPDASRIAKTNRVRVSVPVLRHHKALLGRVSCWSPLGLRPGVLHAPNSYLFSSRRHIRVWVLLRLILSLNSVAVHRFVRPHFVINSVLIATSLFLLVFLIALAGISLRGEVIRVTRVITNGAVV